MKQNVQNGFIAWQCLKVEYKPHATSGVIFLFHTFQDYLSFLVIEKEYIHNLLVRYFLMQTKKQRRVEKKILGSITLRTSHELWK